MKPQYHVFVCAQQRQPGHPRGSCAAKGAGGVLQKLSQTLMAKNLLQNVSIMTTGCMGPCDQGANVMVFPGAHLYANMSVEDIENMVSSHLLGGEPLTEKLLPEYS